MQEIFFELPGKKIAAKVWHPERKIRVLALHGWLDNAASFDKLAPLLPHAQIVALDLPGHGHSDHQPLGTYIHLTDYVVVAAQVMHQLNWERCILLGHSIGAAIACLIAGTIPEKIQGVALIDGLGPFTTSPEQAPFQLHHFIQEVITKPHKKSPRYASQEAALQARLKVNAMDPASAKAIVERGTKQLSTGEWIWRTDPKLLFPSALQLTEEQVLAFLREISAPVRLVRPEQGFPFNLALMKKRYETIKNIDMITLPGNHHVHLDNPQPVADYFSPFFDKLSANR